MEMKRSNFKVSYCFGGKCITLLTNMISYYQRLMPPLQPEYMLIMHDNAKKCDAISEK
jgi:hypothetical protein